MQYDPCRLAEAARPELLYTHRERRGYRRAYRQLFGVRHCGYNFPDRNRGRSRFRASTAGVSHLSDNGRRRYQRNPKRDPHEHWRHNACWSYAFYFEWISGWVDHLHVIACGRGQLYRAGLLLSIKRRSADRHSQHLEFNPRGNHAGASLRHGIRFFRFVSRSIEPDGFKRPDRQLHN